MWEHALIPVNVHRRLDDTLTMTTFLENFATSHVTLVHVDSAPEHHKTIDALNVLRQQLADAGLETDIVLRRGHVATAVVEAAHTSGSDFICIPWRRKGMLKRGLLGSITTDIIRMADIPVFVYKKHGSDIDGNRLHRVLYATEFARTDNRVMPYLTSHGIKATHLTLLHVGQRAPDPVAEQARRVRVNKNLNRLTDSCRSSFTHIDQVEVIGSPKRQIVRHARRLNTDLIIIGTFDSENPLEQVLGSTAEGMTHAAPCSVLTIPGIKTRGGS